MININNKMINSNQEKLNKYERKQKGQRIIEDKRLIINLDQKENLILIIENEETYQCYQLLVDENYLTRDQNLSRFFATPKDLHYTFLQLLETLTIVKNDIVLLKVSFQPSKINLIKQFEFKLEMKPQRTNEILKTKILKFKVQNEELHKQIQFQRQRRVKDKQSYLQQLDEQTQQNQNLKKNLRQLQSQLKSLRDELNEKTKQNEQLIELNNQKLSSIKQLTETSQSNTNQIIYLQGIIKSYEFSIIQYKKLLNQQNPHYYSFHYSLVDEKSLSIIKKNDNGWNNFITKSLIPSQDPLIFNIKIKHTKDGSICLGICNSTVFGNICIDCSSSITYLCRDGSIYDKGIRKFGGIPILNQCCLRIEIDWKKNIISWHKQNKKLGETVFDNYRKDKIYLIAKMFWKSDEIEINL